MYTHVRAGEVSAYGREKRCNQRPIFKADEKLKGKIGGGERREEKRREKIGFAGYVWITPERNGVELKLKGKTRGEIIGDKN